MKSLILNENSLRNSNGVKKILVLYAKSGFMGHMVIAQNYAALLEKAGYEVRLGDAFQLNGKTEVKTGNALYFWVIKNAPWIWQALYMGWLHIPGAHFFKNRILPTRFKQTQKFILSEKPDAIVTTHPVATSTVNYLKMKKKYTGPLFTTFSDYHTQPFHVYKGTDKFFLATPEQIDDLIKLGIPKEKAMVPGILVSEKYYNIPTKEEARKQLNLPGDKTIILVMGGGKGWGIDKTIKTLANLKNPALAIIVGGSDERRNEIELKIKNYESRIVTFQVTGFIEPSLYFAAADLLISKPGGLTSTQAFLLKLPLLATSPLPGQEDINIRYLLAKGAIALEDKKGFSRQIDELISSPEKLREIAENAYKLAPVDAPRIVLETIKNALY